jgi:putative restriction endonuclease
MTDASQQLIDAIQKILERQSPLDLINIYQRVRQIEHLDLSRFTSEAGLEARIRKLIYLHASECELYQGEQDLFYSETRKGTGRWGFRRKNATQRVRSDQITRVL